MEKQEIKYPEYSINFGASSTCKWSNYYEGAVNFRKPLTPIKKEVVSAYAKYIGLGNYVIVQNEIVTIETSSDYSGLPGDDPAVKFLHFLVKFIGDVSSMEVFYRGMEDNMDMGEYSYDKKKRDLVYRGVVLGNPDVVNINYVENKEG
jgi:hypothetical protein